MSIQLGSARRRFSLRSADGRVFETIERARYRVRPDLVAGLVERTPTSPLYETTDGQRVRKLDAGTYIIPSLGNLHVTEVLAADHS